MYVSSRELDILKILWKSDKPLAASEIAEKQDDLKIVTIQTCLKKLVQKRYIEVAEIVQIGKALARTYRALIHPDTYITDEFNTFFSDTDNKISFSKGLIAALLDGAEEAENILLELEAFIDERKKVLKAKHEN